MKNKDNIDIKYIGVPNICFSLTDKDDDREEEFSKQRMERGFDDSETWCLASAIAGFTLPRLKRFKDAAPCVPYGMKEEEWNEILCKMIRAFELMLRENASWIYDESEQKEVDEGLDLFREHFMSLWW